MFFKCDQELFSIEGFDLFLVFFFFFLDNCVEFSTTFHTLLFLFLSVKQRLKKLNMYYVDKYNFIHSKY